MEYEVGAVLWFKPTTKGIVESFKLKLDRSACSLACNKYTVLRLIHVVQIQAT